MGEEFFSIDLDRGRSLDQMFSWSFGRPGENSVRMWQTDERFPSKFQDVRI